MKQHDQSQFQPQPQAPLGWAPEEDDLLDAQGPPGPPGPPGLAESLAESFGSAPWWMISGSFHGLLLLLLTLIGMALFKTKVNDVTVLTDLVKKNPPLIEEPRKPVVQRIVHLPIEAEVAVETPLVTPEQLVEDVPERPDETLLDQHDPKGNKGPADIDTENFGVVGVLGLSGGGSNSFGRPNGRGARLRRARKGGGGPATEAAVQAALEWLAKHQEPDGHWDCIKYGGKQADVAVTGLALLAFLGAGHTAHVGPYKDNVRRAADWLKSIQQDDGKLYQAGATHGVGYHHAIAGMALAEAAGMDRHLTGIRKAAQRAIDYSIQLHQQGTGSERGGWRYAPKSSTADLSVSGWFIMQLKSARVAGLRVDPAAFDGAIRFLDRVEQKGNAGDPYSGHRYGYTDNRSINHRRTAIGCLARQFLAWPKGELQGGIEWFVQRGGVPAWGANGGQVDLYYWYYGTLCTFQQGGEVWKRWNPAMKKALVDNQRRGGNEHGSWDPVGAYSGYWGRVGQTALGALCLEVYYRYPLILK